jgi:hypothetical protein
MFDSGSVRALARLFTELFFPAWHPMLKAGEILDPEG